MPIEFNCAKCQKVFSVADTSAGKQGRCNDCGYLNAIPNSAAAAPSNAPATFEITSSVNGAVFGPADQNTLKRWLQEGRITPECQIKQVGAENWIVASQFFPQLGSSDQDLETVEVAEIVDAPTSDPFEKFKSNSVSTNAQGGSLGSASTSANPYSAGTTGERKLAVSGEITPTSGDIGFIFSRAFDVYVSNFGVVFGGFVLFFIGMIGSVLVAGMLEAIGDVGKAIGPFIFIGICCYLFAGYLNLCLKLGRGERTGLVDAFAVGDRILPLLGFGLLNLFAFLLPAFVFGLIIGFLGKAGGGPAEAVLLGLILVIVPCLVALFAGLLLWPGVFLILDRKSTIFQAFHKGFAIAKKNILQFIAVYILAVLITWVGFFGLFIGVIFTAPIGILIVCCAYLNMSGQIRE